MEKEIEYQGLKPLPRDGDSFANSFVANGTKYLIHPTLSIGRYEMYEELEIIFGNGASHKEIFEELTAVFELVDKMKFAQAAIRINNMITAVSRSLHMRTTPMLLLCSLFIAKEGEDLSRWNEAEALEKIADWRADGYRIDDFFEFAFSCVTGLHQNYRLSLARSLEEAKEVEDAER